MMNKEFFVSLHQFFTMTEDENNQEEVLPDSNSGLSDRYNPIDIQLSDGQFFVIG